LRELLAQERAALIEREKQIVHDWERKETAKMQDLETRFEEMQRRWQERADTALARIAETSEKRKAADHAHRAIRRG
jgi:hypothetical protein